MWTKQSFKTQVRLKVMDRTFLIKNEAVGFQLCSDLVLCLQACRSSSHRWAFSRTIQSGSCAGEGANTARTHHLLHRGAGGATHNVSGWGGKCLNHQISLERVGWTDCRFWKKVSQSFLWKCMKLLPGIWKAFGTESLFNISTYHRTASGQGGERGE